MCGSLKELAVLFEEFQLHPSRHGLQDCPVRLTQYISIFCLTRKRKAQAELQVQSKDLINGNLTFWELKVRFPFIRSLF